MNNPIPTGRIAFYVSPENNEIYYSVVKVKGRYADQHDVIELPRGEPDDFYVNRSLPERDPNYRIVVERSKEAKAVAALGIQDGGEPLATLAAHGYEYERTESLEEAGKRELHEEHGFNDAEHGEMAKQLITMRPFPVNASYGSPVEYRSFLQIEGDVSQIALQSTDKVETKAPKRMGVAYVEQGEWATLREIRENAAEFMALAKADTTSDGVRLLEEAVYQQSIADWMEHAEAAVVNILRSQRQTVQTTSAVDPRIAVRNTDAKVAQDLGLGR